MKRPLFVLLATIFLFVFSYGQTDTVLLRQKAIKIYLDGFIPDMQYVKQHMDFVNFVRDHHDADVYILVVQQESGSGGSKFTIFFNGQKRFKGQNDTLWFSTPPDATMEDVRTSLVKYLTAGLLPYISKTELFKNFSFVYNNPQKNTNKIVEDKWHSWVFEIGLHGMINGESRFKDNELNSSFDVYKVTPQWILDFSTDYSWEQSKYVITNTQTVTSLKRSYSFSGLIVKSLTDHWSLGLKTYIGQSTFMNYKLHAYFYPGIEYNIFPYSQSTIHELRILYTLGPEQNVYFDTTLFNKIQQLTLRQQLSVNYSLKKKWGSITLSLDGASYLYDLSKNSLSLSTYINLRIVKGLSFNVMGSYGFIHDQINLPKTNLSEEEILTQERQLKTQYRYSVFFGVSYTFGAIYNNVVNPRFGHGTYHVFYF